MDRPTMVELTERRERDRAARLAEVTALGGPLTLVDTVFLEPGDSQEFPGLPGRWSFDGHRVLLHGESGVWTDRGLPVSGTHPVIDDDAEKASELRFEVAGPHGVVRARVQLALRGGTTGLRLWRDDAPALAAFAGVDYFDVSSALVVPGRYRPYGPGERADDYTYASLDLPYRHEAPGELSFTVDGVDCAVPVYSTTPTGLFVVLADATRGVEVDQPMRSLTVPLARSGSAAPDGPAPDGSLSSLPVLVDFNRMRLFPCAFSPHFTCPLPGPQNVIPVPLRGGERAVLNRS